MVLVVRKKVNTVLSLLVSSALAFVVVSGCNKTNEINPGQSAGGLCNGEACDGACIEGSCRAHCDANYKCSGDDVCTAMNDVPVCMPPDARIYEPYAPFDMLAKCAQSGCEVPLDAPPVQGVLRACDGAFTPADMANPNFDYASACATPPSYLAKRLIQGRRIYQIPENGGSCTWRHVGGGPSETLIGYMCNYDWTDTLITRAEFSRVVKQGNATYVWTGDDTYAQLSVLVENEQLDVPASCAFESSAYGEDQALPKDCELPTYPTLGRAVGPEFAGLWVRCDTPNAEAPEACDLSFNGPSPDGHQRSAYYIDARGYGEMFSFEGSATQAKPTQCNAAFRLTRRRITVPGDESQERIQGYVLESKMPFGSLSLNAELFEEVIEVTEGPGSAAGTYIVGNERTSYWYKRVPLPADFVDPCQATQPRLTW